MPYEISWMLEDHIVFMRDYGVCTLEEMSATVEKLNSMLDSGAKPIHIIHDNRAVEKYPVSIKAIKPIVNKHPNAGWLVFITNSAATGFIFSVLTKLVGQPARNCGSLEEAVHILQRQDSSLPSDIPVPSLPSL